MTTKVKAPATSPDEVYCHGCAAVWHSTVASARAHKWRVGWLPEHPSWCPECWRKPKTVEVVDINDRSLFDLIEMPEAAT